MKQEKIFGTKDLWLAGALTFILKTPPEYKVEDGQTIFLFPKTDALYSAMVAYNSGCSLPVYEYSQIVKRLRAEIIIRRLKGVKNE